VGREFPEHAIASVGAVVVRGSEILLVERGYPPGEGLWSIPGGVIEPGETIVEASIRELEEETGLRGRPLGVVWVTDSIVREGGRVRYHYVIIDVLFDSSSLTGELRPGGDARSVAWFSLAEASTSSRVTRSTRRLAQMMLEGKLRVIEL